MTERSGDRLRDGRVFGFRPKESIWHLKDVVEKAGIEHVTPHASGRHTFDSRLNEKG
ncbi:MAG: hypothetical protein ABGW82_12965 [Paracoccus sp. (in: a-proteobacteria)]|nr:hypothetical protein [Paracoccus sp. (in: a-proteobacteria)]